MTMEYVSKHFRYYKSDVVEICNNPINNYTVLVIVQQEAGRVSPYILITAEGS